MKTIKEYLSTPEGVEQKWNIINEILEDFNFDEVFIAMEAVDWRWAVTDKDIADEMEEEGYDIRRTGIIDDDWCEYRPKIQDLRKWAREMLIDTIASCPDEETEWGQSSGGFETKICILTDEEKKEVFGEDAPDDFEHSVDLRLKFVFGDSGSRFW
jgi:hypothetical protein